MDSEQDTAVSGLSLSDLLDTELLGFALDDVDLSLSGTGTGFSSSGTPADSYVQQLQAPAPPPSADSLLNNGELR